MVEAKEQKKSAQKKSVSKNSKLIKELEQQLSDTKQQMLRVEADRQNTERRCAQDIEKIRKYSLEGVMQDLIPVLDELTLACDTLDKKHRQGVDMTREKILQLFKRRGVEVISPEIQSSFDPQLHQAVSSVSADKTNKPQTIKELIQPGYSLSDRLIRPATVIIYTD